MAVSSGKHTEGKNREMKAINIINIDSKKLPNLALVKVQKYYEDKGYKIYSSEMLIGKIPTYISVIFDWNRKKVVEYENIKDTFIGGTGYDITSSLPQEIESVKPHINIGFTTRGCIRHCGFCCVPQKEGNIRASGDIYDIWDKKSDTIRLLDNNILALKDHFKLIASQLMKENLLADFEGFDIRLVDDEIAYILSKMRIKQVRFALDFPELIPIVREKLNLLRKYKLRKDTIFYVLVGYNTTWQEDIERLEFLRSEGMRPFVMRYDSVRGNKRYTQLAQWVNLFWSFQKYSFDEFNRIKRGKYKQVDNRQLAILAGKL